MCIKARETPDVFEEIITSNVIPQWLVSLIRKKIIPGPRACVGANANIYKIMFVSKAQDLIKKMGNWAGEIEKQSATRLLAEFGVYLEVKNRVMPRLANVPGRIVLCNLGEYHYRYYSYNRRGGKKTIKKRGNRKTVKSKSTMMSNKVF